MTDELSSPDVLDLTEALTYCHSLGYILHPRTLSVACWKGQIEGAYKTGKHSKWLIPRASLVDWLEESEFRTGTKFGTRINLTVKRANFDGETKQMVIRLPVSLHGWLYSKAAPVSVTIARLIEAEMEREAASRTSSKDNPPT